MSIRRITFASFVLASIATSACSGPAKDEPAACADCAETGGDTGSLFPGFDSDSGAGSTPTTDAAIDDAAIDTAPSCVPADGADDPDDDFKDTNCDGIDGDKSRAIFVAPDGKDDAAGTLDAPVHSFAKAIERANELGKDVYACNGTYAENVVIAKAVRVFGGFDCKAGWKRTLDRARIAPSKGIPLTVNTVATDGVQLDRIALRAPDGVDAGESSIALFANQSKVVVTNGEIEAGSGADGLSPASPASITTPATKGRDAANGTPRECSENLSSMPWTMVYLCTTPELGPQTTTPVPTCEGRGGKGGNGGVGRPEWANAKPPTGGTAGLPAPSPGGPSRTSIGRGLDGAQGAVGASGVSSKVAFGTVTEKGYVADNSGTAGGPGATGGGGSGGWGNVGAAVWAGSFVAYYYNGGAGGEGGFGGCGGAGGEGGGGGGASVGVLSFKSDVSLTRTTITTSFGGRGGAGGVGADGQPGGAAGLGGRSTDPREPPSNRGYDGGAGGAGGRGGNGGAGAGGPSFGVLYVESKPKTDAVSFNVGSGGQGGASGLDKAVAGESAEIFPK